MRAAKFHGEGRITIEQVEDPSPAADESVVRVSACALCGSDFRPWRYGWPVTSGHEIVGRIEQPGHARHGERVVVYIPIFCGQCEDCRAGRTHLCSGGDGRQLIGWQRPGGYAEKLAAPERCLLPVPDDVPDKLAPLLLDTIGTTAHGIRLARRVVTDGNALVLGAGPDRPRRRHHAWRGWASARSTSSIRPRIARAWRNPSARGGPRRRQPPKAGTSWWSRPPERIRHANSRSKRSPPRGPSPSSASSDGWSIKETRSIRLKDFFLVRSFYFPVGDYQENIGLLRADRDKYERLVDGQVGLDGLQELFESFARGEKLKPQVVPA